MKRPLCVIGLTLAPTTLAASLFFPRHGVVVSAAVLLTGLLLFAVSRGRWRTASVVLISVAVGCACAGLHYVRQVAPLEAAAGQEVRVHALVTETEITGRAVFYTVNAVFPRRPELPRTTLKLRAYGEPDYLPGDSVAGTVLLGETVAGPWDYGYSSGVYLDALVIGEMQEGPAAFPLRQRLARVKERMRANVYRHLREESADVVTAMVLGMKDNVDPETYNALNRAGTSHLLAVSGLHLSILAALVTRLLGRLGLKRHGLMAATIGVLTAFAFLVGFSASILRALAMTSITLLARSVSRSRDSLSSLAMAVILICVFQPHWLLGRGFWFSACATLGILVMGVPLSEKAERRFYRSRFRRYLLSAAAVSASAYLFTLPLLVMFNGWITVLAPFANVAVAPFQIPMVAGGIFCALVGVSPQPVRVLATVVDYSVAATVEVSRQVARLPFATLSLDEGWMIFWLLLAVALGAAAFCWRRERLLLRYSATLLVLAFALGALSQRAADRNTVEFAAVTGCDTAVLLRDGEAVLLGTPTRHEINRLLRYLSFRGVDRVQAVVAADCGEQIDSGLLRLEKRYPIDCIIGPNDSYILGQLAEALPGVPVYSGGYATLDALGGVEIRVLLPEGDIRAKTDGGIVLKSMGEYDIMKAGDRGHIECYPGGVLVLDGALGYEPSPVGQALYGERRFRLRLDMMS